MYLSSAYFGSWMSLRHKSRKMFNIASAIFFISLWEGGYSPAVPPHLGCADAINTHLEYVTLMAFRPQQWLHQHAWKLRYSIRSNWLIVSSVCLSICSSFMNEHLSRHHHKLASFNNISLIWTWRTWRNCALGATLALVLRGFLKTWVWYSIRKFTLFLKVR
jgi:hypothetical protein